MSITLEIICEYCGKTKKVKNAWHAKRQRFCSQSCVAKFRFSQGYRIRVKPPPIRKKCEYCQKYFEFTKHDRNRKFCSIKCYWDSKIGTKYEFPHHGSRSEFTCLWCKKTKLIPSHIAKKRTFCSRECYRDFMQANRNDFTGANPFYLSYEWKQIRERIYSRDGDKCLYCGSIKNLVIHHKKPRKEFNDPPEFHPIADADENLETVCGNCHWAIHFEIRLDNSNNQ